MSGAAALGLPGAAQPQQNQQTQNAQLVAQLQGQQGFPKQGNGVAGQNQQVPQQLQYSL